MTGLVAVFFVLRFWLFARLEPVHRDAAGSAMHAGF